MIMIVWAMSQQCKLLYGTYRIHYCEYLSIGQDVSNIEYPSSPVVHPDDNVWMARAETLRFAG